MCDGLQCSGFQLQSVLSSLSQSHVSVCLSSEKRFEKLKERKKNIFTSVSCSEVGILIGIK